MIEVDHADGAVSEAFPLLSIIRGEEGPTMTAAAMGSGNRGQPPIFKHSFA